jgi:hypothetical protein
MIKLSTFSKPHKKPDTAVKFMNGPFPGAQMAQNRFVLQSRREANIRKTSEAKLGERETQFVVTTTYKCSLLK